METAAATMRCVETFIVRLWWPTEARGDEAPRLRGVVDDVSTGARQPFASAEELVEILRQAAPRPRQAVGAIGGSATLEP